MRPEPGLLVVLSGPSGAGKGTLRPYLLKSFPGLEFCVSATTRAPRAGEVHGRHYYFLSVEEFRQRIEEGDLLEWADVYGNLYGTPRRPVLEALKHGKVVLLEKDMQGALQLQKTFPEGVFIFVLPPSLDELKRRLVGRGTETPEAIQRRLTTAMSEIRTVGRYGYAVVNDDLEDAARRLEAIITAERCRVSRQDPAWLDALVGKGEI
ncbi:MAG: guanylate kinase [Symbiobacteriia bacterium]